jgi:hypothetical protein
MEAVLDAIATVNPEDDVGATSVIDQVLDCVPIALKVIVCPAD